MKMMCVAAVAGLACAAGAQTRLEFSTPDFEWFAQGLGPTPYHIWTSGDFWRQTFTGTGLPSATRMDLELQIDDAAIQTMDFGAYVNGVRVGGLTLEPGHFNTLQVFSFTFAAIAGEDYTIAIVGESTVDFGFGSYSIEIEGPSAAILTPAPSAMALLGVGGLVATRRRR